MQRLIATQFPHWSDLPIRAVEPGGWDNRTFRLGDQMSVRLPSAAEYAPQVDKEHHWLPKLAPNLPLAIPVPLAKGRPDSSYPWSWSIYRWLPGECAAVTHIADRSTLAYSLARFLLDLRRVETAGGPPPGAHCFQRGAPVSVYDAEVRRAMDVLRIEIDSMAVRSIWESAVKTTWNHAPVWFHGDLAAGNLLLTEGRLVAVIDFGCCGVGDPACDLAIAWTLFSGESRVAFRAALEIDDEAWLRGRAWALWKALITIVEYSQSDTNKADDARRVLGEILADDLTA
ncbi:MAG: aminoglycoside phosphotransferase family protein [Burkholderiales bacterium]|nr:aminoglycoside phosphotransferase family protein [Burkholderiales bacterium]